jgi:hypothetical protein
MGTSGLAFSPNRSNPLTNGGANRALVQTKDKNLQPKTRSVRKIMYREGTKEFGLKKMPFARKKTKRGKNANENLGKSNRLQTSL